MSTRRVPERQSGRRTTSPSGAIRAAGSGPPLNGQAHSDRAPDINGIGPISEDGDRHEAIGIKTVFGAPAAGLGGGR